MAVKQTVDPVLGDTVVKATGKDVRSLLGAFKDENGRDREKKAREQRENPERRMRRADGHTAVVPGRVAEQRARSGWDVAEPRPGVTLPDNWLGFTKDGRAVYRRKSRGFTRAVTRDGWKGWSPPPDS